VSAQSTPVSVTTPTQATTGAITGTVTTKASGAPLANVTVAYTVSGAKKSTKTNASGSYSINALPPGTYTLTFTTKGKSGTATASVTAGHTTAVDIAL